MRPADPFRLIYYETPDGRVPFYEWLDGLHDRIAALRVEARLGRARAGNLGDHKSLGGGLLELRLAFGSGYRIYATRDGERLLLLLCAGDKSTQRKDIELARSYHEDYVQRQRT